VKILLQETIIGWVGAGAGLIGAAVGWVVCARANKRDMKDETSQETMMKVDMEYLKRGVDDIRTQMREQNQRYDQLVERVVRVEESTKQAHKRIEELKKGNP
jgi:tRNA(Phe) wybutosine-synthesizing methylase Tyw3